MSPQLPIGNISRADILAFRAKLAELLGKSSRGTLSAARINTIIVPLRMILREAAGHFETRQGHRIYLKSAR